MRRNRRSWGSPGKDELQGRLDVATSGLQGPQAQLVVLDAHVPQLLQLRLPLALQKDRSGQKPSAGTLRTPTQGQSGRWVPTAKSEGLEALENKREVFPIKKRKMSP